MDIESLRVLMKQHKISQKGIADHLGVSQPTISQALKGNGKEDTLTAIIDYVSAAGEPSLTAGQLQLAFGLFPRD